MTQLTHQSGKSLSAGARRRIPAPVRCRDQQPRVTASCLRDRAVLQRPAEKYYLKLLSTVRCWGALRFQPVWEAAETAQLSARRSVEPVDLRLFAHKQPRQLTTEA